MLHAPPGARETFRRITGAWEAEELIEHAFEVREYDPGAELELGALRVRFHEVPHFIRTYAVQLRDRAGDASPTAPTAGRTTRSSSSRATATC